MYDQILTCFQAVGIRPQFKYIQYLLSVAFQAAIQNLKYNDEL